MKWRREYACFLFAEPLPADGIGLGFIAYVGIKILAGRARGLDLMIVAIAVAFIAKFLWL